MPGYFIASYDVNDPEEYAKYNPGSMDVLMGTMTKHGGKVLVAGPQDDWIAGKRNALVVIEFPTVEAAKAWTEDPEYAKIKPFRLNSTTNRLEVIAAQFEMPKG
jgi:uncharacterized protein (DUF1330 family)